MKSINRVQPTSDETPPWAGMSFTQPVDSDALHELLKHQYPQCKTLRQRKHMAAIDFLRSELDSMQSGDAEMTNGTPGGNQALVLVNVPQPGIEDSDERKHRRSISPSLSQVSSYRSLVLQDHHLQQPPARSKTEAGQQHVFSIVNGLATQPKKKRKMTPEERSAYKTTRKLGACDKCKRKKGKCTHVIETLMPMGKAVHEEVNLQRPHATPPVLITDCNAEDPARTHEGTRDLSQQSRTSLRTSPMTQSATASGSPRWAQVLQETQEGGRSEILGYVPLNVTAPYPWPLQRSQEIQWSNQSSFVEPQSFQSDYDGYIDPSDQPECSPTFLPYQDFSPKDMQYPPGLLEQSWNQSAGYMSGEANPG